MNKLVCHCNTLCKIEPQIKIEGKGYALKYHAVITRRSEIWSRALLTLALYGSGQIHAPAALPPRTEPLVSTQ